MILQAGRGRSSSPRKRSAPDPASEGMDSRESSIADSMDPHGKERATTVIPAFHQSTHTIESLVTASHISDAPNKSSLQQNPRCLSEATMNTSPRPLKRQRSVMELDQMEEQRRISALRAAALRSSRPTDAALICCDYNAAEHARARGVYGREEFGGGHLCIECLGQEIRSENKDC